MVQTRGTKLRESVNASVICCTDGASLAATEVIVLATDRPPASRKPGKVLSPCTHAHHGSDSDLVRIPSTQDRICPIDGCDEVIGECGDAVHGNSPSNLDFSCAYAKHMEKHKELSIRDPNKKNKLISKCLVCVQELFNGREIQPGDGKLRRGKYDFADNKTAHDYTHCGKIHFVGECGHQGVHAGLLLSHFRNKHKIKKGNVTPRAKKVKVPAEKTPAKKGKSPSPASSSAPAIAQASKRARELEVAQQPGPVKKARSKKAAPAAPAFSTAVEPAPSATDTAIVAQDSVIGQVDSVMHEPPQLAPEPEEETYDQMDENPEDEHQVALTPPNTPVPQPMSTIKDLVAIVFDLLPCDEQVTIWLAIQNAFVETPTYKNYVANATLHASGADS